MQYTFLPWLRRGLSKYITTTQSGSGNDKSSQPQIATQIALTDGTTIAKTVTLHGPADVLGIDKEAIIRMEPRQDSQDFETDFACFVEFYEEDFPWRYTPFAPENDGKLTPWLALVVAKKDEFDLVEGKNPKVIIKKAGVLPDPTTLWATAHVQVSANVSVAAGQSYQDAVDIALETNPDLGLSRLMSLRPLESNTEYQVFLVPVFEKARLTLLEQDPSNAKLNQIGWNASSNSLELPFYANFEFKTSENASFETAFQKLMNSGVKYGFPPDLMDLQSTYQTLETPYKLTNGNDTTHGNRAMPAQFAFHAHNFSYEYWADNGNVVDYALKQNLADMLNQNALQPINEDPYIDTPPIYGANHLDRHVVDANGNLGGKGWIEQINLDLSLRAVAGLGNQVVRENSEELMSLAWQQVENVIEANNKIRMTEFSAAVSQKIFDKHIATKDNEGVLKMTSNLHEKVGMTQNLNVKTAIESSSLPVSSMDAAFKKIIHPNSPWDKRAKGNVNIQLGNSLVTKLASNTTQALKNISAAPEKKAPANIVPQTSMAAPQLFGSAFAQLDTTNAANAKADFTQMTTAANKVKTDMKPTATLNAKLSSEISIPNASQVVAPTPNSFRLIMAAPTIPIPAVSFLTKHFPDFILPAGTYFPDNALSLAAVNNRFVDAFMVGLNQALAGELLWRNYPTDQRGTYFNSFWNRHNGQEKDIAPIHQWPAPSKLGEHIPAGTPTPNLIMVVKGDLLRQYPNLVLYAHKATANAAGKKSMASNTAANQRYPLFALNVGNGVSILAFDLSLEDAIGDAQNPGWYFVAKERPGELRFRIGGTSPTLSAQDNGGIVASRLFSQPFIGAFHFGRLKKLVE